MLYHRIINDNIYEIFNEDNKVLLRITLDKEYENQLTIDTCKDSYSGPINLLRVE